MRVLYVESAISGHRVIYHKTLIKYVGGDNCVLITPKAEPEVECAQVVDDTIQLKPRSLGDYKKWIVYVKEIAEKNGIDVIHFLDGDILYKFWGFGLEKIRCYKVVVTFHHVKNDLAHNYSVKRISNKVFRCVVHTDLLKQRFDKLNNVVRIHYPYFSTGVIPTRQNARKFFSIESDCKVLLALGATRYEKGIDILIDSLNYIKSKNLMVLIAGKEDCFSEKSLREINQSNIEVLYFMKKLTDDEWNNAIVASDFIVLPYRNTFTGASGPLTEAAAFGKVVIGTNKESVGDIIKKYKLGYTFNAEDAKNLASVIDDVLCSDFVITTEYRNYVHDISEEGFVRQYITIYSE